jgi:uncharacterized membrane protein YwzB
MSTIIVESFERELVWDIWSLQSDQVELEETLAKTEGIPAQIIATIQLTSAVISFIVAVAGLIKKRHSTKARNTKIIVHTRKGELDFKQLTARFEESVRIEIHEDDE